ncbi:hypothetical protein [Altibacter sp.]|uniref:hypothetical protein n=1 Tax=Altibacter sp. TaxID=2024823 RepID=UPI002587310A|nr:hypothetical protein [Altibacter sp.]MCW9038132.1 hypothetical protein [Altibacter sp.]
MKYYLTLILFAVTYTVVAQDFTSNYRSKKVAVQDTIQIDSVSINPSRFYVEGVAGATIDSVMYRVDYSKARLILSEAAQTSDSITIHYLRYPKFLVQEYYALNPKIISESTGSIEKLYSLDQSNQQDAFTPFEGLNTVGSISRGVTIGNNQNAVVNSELDLQITGQLSDKVSIRASIQDANIPTQEGGYSQSLDEFDQIFIELYSDDWNIRAGDVDLQNTTSYFARFNKKVQGISLGGTLTHNDGSRTTAFAAGALVRGVFAKSNFVGQEGNQGPYKLVGPNGELFILIVSGSERVYVNGILLTRGENEDYVIDYNAGEIKFNPIYPITNNMRISVEYQYTDRNYTRFIGYGGGSYSTDNLDIGVYAYSENDAKNQPLQQNLSEEQVTILQAAGDDRDNMTAPSAVPDTFSENKILYKKDIVDGVEIFVFSNDPEDELFNVRFTLVGANMGNYVISDASAISRIFEYIAPLNGIPQGNYEPIIQLTAPTKLQIGGLKGNYHPSEKTILDFEVAGSKNDLNLFSSIDDGNNDGFAGRLAVKQTLLTTTDTLKIDGFASADYINQDFRNIERVYNIEFNRDWNLISPMGDQSFIISGVEAFHPKHGSARYEFQQLDFSENYSGSRHVGSTNLRFDKLQVYSQGSYLKGTGDSLESKFSRLNSLVTYSMKKSWLGGKIAFEDNQVSIVQSDSLSPVSQKFRSYEVFSGIGDSTNIFVEVGYRRQSNDSLRQNFLQKVNSSNTYFLKSRLINGQDAQLSVFANYRILKDEFGAKEDEKSLNSRILYNQSIWNGGVSLNTVLSSNNGVIPRQEFTYVKVDPGQGIYTWNDYNNNGIQELDEFEIAQFQDEAEYVRILLPNQIFLKIRQNQFSQILTLNPRSWENKEGFKKFLSHFYNQASYILDRKVQRRNDGFNINPFEDGGDDQLGLVLNFRNALFFNRGKQHYTTSYTYIATSSDNLLSLGLQKNRLESHQLAFNHKIWESWLVNLRSSLGSTESTSENFGSRNYTIDSYELAPKLSYLLNAQTRFDVFYSYGNKDNQVGDMEALLQQKGGVSFGYSNVEKISLNGEFSYIENTFDGSAFSPVAYQMLEGLQPGTNFTWNLLLQKRITKYLDANLSYFGRKSETSKTVHTGSIQLRAFF